MLTLERLKEVLCYNEATGVFTWKIGRKGRGTKAGKPAGTINPDGYLQIGIDGKTYRAHRLAVYYITGRWPVGNLDHRDTIRTNNAFLNLRQANHSQNAANVGPHKDSLSGLKGVSFCKDKKRKPWQARIRAAGVEYLLGRFPTPEEAHLAYQEAANRLHGEFARTT